MLDVWIFDLFFSSIFVYIIIIFFRNNILWTNVIVIIYYWYQINLNRDARVIWFDIKYVYWFGFNFFYNLIFIDKWLIAELVLLYLTIDWLDNVNLISFICHSKSPEIPQIHCRHNVVILHYHPLQCPTIE